MDWQHWLDSGSLILPWEGPIPALPEGSLLVQSSYTWIVEGLFSNLTRHTPDLLEFFLEDQQGLPMDEPLLGLIDQGFEYTTLFQVLWELRFWAQENPAVTPDLVSALRSWLRGFPLSRESQLILQSVAAGRPPETPYQRLDRLCFLLTWGRQQGFIRNSVFAVIGLNFILEFNPDLQKIRLQELHDLYLLANRWRRFGGGIKLVYEFSRTPEFLRVLHEYCPRLETPLRCNSKG